MKKSILISGIGGSGKSTLARFLGTRGYETYDLEEIPGMFHMVHKVTGKETPDSEFDNANLRMLENHDWNIDKQHLADLIRNQTHDIAFYSGIAANHDDVIDLFSKVVILVASPEEIRSRLSQRKEGEYGHNPEVIDNELSWKAWWEEKAKQNGAIAVNADKELQVMADEILAVTLNE